MSAIKKVGNLSKAHLDYITLAAARTSSLVKIKEEFQKFFETPIDGTCLMEAVECRKSEIQSLRESLPFEEKVKEIDLGDPAQQLQMLSDLHKECLTPRVCNITRDGAEVMKVDLPTAARCLELANKVLLNERLLELKKLELGSNTTPVPSISSTGDGVPKIQIIHSKGDSEEF
jgi:hypothetical protein